MNFTKIKFHNYRCFVDGELEFNQQNGKNINLIIGTNGAGKTEVLFAFWWALYGFDFSTLKNKESTAYSLNTTLYRNVESGELDVADCSVTIELEYQNTIYVIERKAVFRKNGRTVRSVEEQSIGKYKPNGELGIPETDSTQVNAILNGILPKTILYGIVFDGERMKQLTSEDENSVQAVQGVINDITNVSLIQRCLDCYAELKKNNNIAIRKIAKQNGNKSLEELQVKIDDNESALKDAKERKEELRGLLDEHEAVRNKLSQKLRLINEVKAIETQRETVKKNIESEIENQNILIKNFSTSLKNGHLLLCTPIFKAVSGLLTNYKVPAGLTVEAVENILKDDKCICGRAWTPEMIHILELLKDTLPPDNINSTLGEMVRQNSMAIDTTKAVLQNDQAALSASKKKVNTLKTEWDNLSSQISNSGSDDAVTTQEAYDTNMQETGKLKDEWNNLTNEIPELEKTLASLKKDKESISDNSVAYQQVITGGKYIEKCIKALECIRECNRSSALTRINEKLSEAYSTLSDDSEYGRRLYIIQFNERSKYNLITYYEKDYQETLQKMQQNGEYNNMLERGQSKEDIQESIIIKCAVSRSTGQSKMNTLSFVKAILDYSNEMKAIKDKDRGLFVNQKEYPLLIDAPFGDIFGDNLTKSANALSGFTHQIILMLAQDSYDGIAEYIKPHISTVHFFEKQENKTYSTIRAGSLEEL